MCVCGVVMDTLRLETRGVSGIFLEVRGYLGL